MIESSELFARMWEMDEDQAMLRETLRDFVDERIVPRREELDRTAKYPRDLHDEIVEMGLLAMGMPEEAGGMDMGALEQAVVFEELGRGCTGLATGVGANLLGSDPILLYGTPEQKVEYLSKIASGSIGAYALTEPNAGTDAGGIGTIATLQEDGETYKLSGQKTYITNAGIASIYTIFALTDPKRGARGVSCFIAEIDPENPPAGIEFPPKFDKMGINASETREIIFDGFEVKKANIVGGKPGRGFLQAMGCFDMSRPMIGTIGVGLAQSAFDAALRYGHERIQFGQPIIRFSGLRQIFVDMWLRIAGARAMVIGGARKVHRKFHEGVKEDVTAWSAMAKLMGSEAGRVTYDALQTTGGYGYMNETPFPKMMRDHKILEIFEGTNQIQREQTGRQLIQQFQKHGTARPAEAEASLSKGAASGGEWAAQSWRLLDRTMGQILSDKSVDGEDALGDRQEVHWILGEMAALAESSRFLSEACANGDDDPKHWVHDLGQAYARESLLQVADRSERLLRGLHPELHKDVAPLLDEARGAANGLFAHRDALSQQLLENG
jgi:alkylation response protein AidB-like acyl-CoA dehydrogenase